jgi:4-amino-4-deoxy-L-arabinose transferase-like glycosyltransferase
VLAIGVDPRANFHFDMTWYDLAALTLLDGRVLTSPEGVATAFWPPGYPALLATAYAVFGASIRTAQGLNVALACLTCWFTHALALRVCRESGHAQVCALGAAAIVAIFPGYVFFAPLTLSENAFIPLLCGLLLLFVRFQDSTSARPFPHWCGFGALLGVAMLTRGAASLFFAVPIAFWWFETRSARTVGIRAAALALGVAVVVLPWTTRNVLTMGSPVIVSTSVGMALTYAHSPVADGSESLRMVSYRRNLLEALQSLPNPQREVREMQLGVQAALRYALSHPLRELSLIPRRLFFLFQHDHAGLDWAIPQGAPVAGAAGMISGSIDRVLGAIASVFFWVVCGLAMVGGWARRRDTGVQILIVTVGYFVVLHGVLFVGNPRYHAPLYPVLAVLAAIGCSTLFQLRSTESTRRVEPADPG